MRRVALFFATLVAVAAGSGLLSVAAARAAGDIDTVVLTNQEREASGENALTVAPDLQAAAQRHAEDMAAAGALWHTPNLATIVGNWRRLGENVGRGPDAAAIHAGFLGSPTHRANVLLASYSQIGVGAVTASDGRLYLSVLYRQPMFNRLGGAHHTSQAVVRLSTGTASSASDVQVAAATVSKGDPQAPPAAAARNGGQLAAGDLHSVSPDRMQVIEIADFLALALLAIAVGGHALRLRSRAQ